MPTLEEKLRSVFRIRNKLLREFLAEFFSDFLLIAFGCGANAQSLLSGGKAGEYLSVCLAWGVAVMIATWTTFKISGAQLNPALTFAYWIIGRNSTKQLLMYWLGQYLGAFVASAAVFGVYNDALYSFDGGVRSVVGENATAGIWATYPNNFLRTESAFGDQVFGVFILVLVSMGVIDKDNTGPDCEIIPLYAGAAVSAFIMTFSFNCGGAINPARDLSPRLFTAVAGWGTEVFTAYNYFFWIPVVAPHIGAICAALTYVALVGSQVKPEKEKESISTADDKLTPLPITGVTQIQKNLPETESNGMESSRI